MVSAVHVRRDDHLLCGVRRKPLSCLWGGDSSGLSYDRSTFQLPIAGELSYISLQLYTSWTPYVCQALGCPLNFSISRTLLCACSHVVPIKGCIISPHWTGEETEVQRGSSDATLPGTEEQDSNSSPCHSRGLPCCCFFFSPPSQI